MSEFRQCMNAHGRAKKTFKSFEEAVKWAHRMNKNPKFIWAQVAYKKFKMKKTNRGFDYNEFTDDYGAVCSLQKSSSANEDKIWLGINYADPKIMVHDADRMGLPITVDRNTEGWQPFVVPDEVLMNTRMHLTQDQVAELLPYLQRFVETGYLT